MPRETQLDTHEIDKLLADEDFIDDFDFSQSDENSRKETEGEQSEGKSAAADDEEELNSDPTAARKISAPASETMVSGVTEELEQDVFELDFFSPGISAASSRTLKLVAAGLVLLWFVQLGAVAWLLHRPLRMPAVRQPLVAMELPVEKPPDLPVADSVAVKENKPEVAAKPILCPVAVYLPIYSLSGLKIFSVDLQIVQHPGAVVLSQAETEQLAVGLRSALEKIVGRKLYEEQSDLKERLTVAARKFVIAFLRERRRNLERFEVRLVGSILE